MSSRRKIARDLTEAIETALRFGKGKINVIPFRVEARCAAGILKNAADTAAATGREFPFSTGWHCAHCDLDIRPPTPGLFSFNNPLGACPECRGFGRTIAIDLNQGDPGPLALDRARRGARFPRAGNGRIAKGSAARLRPRGDRYRIPFEELPKADQDFVINGEKRAGEYTDEDYENDRWYGVRGFFRWLESKTYKMHVRVLLSRYRAYTTCPSCRGRTFPAGGAELQNCSGGLYRRESDRTALTARRNSLLSPEFAALPISDALDILADIEVAPDDRTAAMLRNEICARLSYLCEVGVGYLTLDRSTRTLSGGEMQRVNLTTCLGASLVNTLFVMDEPSVGLHPRDVGRLVRVMHNLRDKGNTLLVVEHEEQIIRAADNLIDIGPGRGERGGELVSSGQLDEFWGSAAPRTMPQSRSK